MALGSCQYEQWARIDNSLNINILDSETSPAMVLGPKGLDVRFCIRKKFVEHMGTRDIQVPLFRFSVFAISDL